MLHLVCALLGLKAVQLLLRANRAVVSLHSDRRNAEFERKIAARPAIRMIYEKLDLKRCHYERSADG